MLNYARALRCLAVAWTLASAPAPKPLLAAGFAVYEQSVSGLGTAFAGSSASAEDISTIFYNPAGLARLSGTELSAGLHLVVPRARFDTARSSDVSGRPLTGGDGGNGGQDVLIPNLYFAADLAERVRFGLGITSPFGLATKYDRDWRGRYEAIQSELQTVNINPTLSYAMGDKWSVGFGLNAQYLDINLSNAIDFGTLCVVQLGAGRCAGLGLAPQAADGRVKIRGNDWGWGYNLGVLFEPTSDTRIGLAYRSKVSYRVRGDARFDVPAQARPLARGAFTNGPAHADIEVPETVAVGMLHQLSPRWAIMSDLSWTRWSRVRRLEVKFDNPRQPTSIQDFDWDNTLRLSLGLRYRPNAAWTLRTGIAYDQTPIPNGRHREFRIPDNDRYWLGLGAGYRATPRLQLNFAYAHLFLDDPQVDRTDAFGHTLVGEYDADIDIISAEMRWTL